MFRLSAALLVLTSALVSGCEPCDQIVCLPCVSPVTIQVRDASGTLIDAATTGDPRFTCSRGVCSGGNGAGVYSLTISAPGFAAQDVDVAVAGREPEGCCDCPFEPQTATVTLTSP